MRFEVTERKLKWQFSYDIAVDGQVVFFATATRVLLPKFRTARLLTADGKELARLREESLMLKLLSLIPVVSDWTNRSFAIMKCDDGGERPVGQIRSRWSLIYRTAVVRYFDREYRIFSHSGGWRGEKYGLFAGQTQVALIHRNPKTEWGAHRYWADFESDVDLHLAVLVMLFVDLVWHTQDVPTSMYQKRWQWRWGWDRLSRFRKVDPDWTPGQEAEARPSRR